MEFFQQLKMVKGGSMTKLDFYRLLLTRVRDGRCVAYDAGDGLRFIASQYVNEFILDHALTVKELKERLKGVER